MGNTRNRASAEGAVDLRERTRAFLAARVGHETRLCLGLSGGLDSIVLLHLLADLRRELGFRLDAVHVHHGLSPNAGDWSTFCEAQCASLGVPLRVERVVVAPGGRGLEAAARAARYAAFAGQSTDCIVLAHHLDDQIETFFMRLLRGAGVRGLAAMADDTAWHDLRILRPLLAAPRDELLRYAEAAGLSYVEDESNADAALTRNFLRHAVLPAIERRFPAYRETLARDIRRLREAESLLNEVAREDLARFAQPDNPDVATMAALGEARAKNALRHWLRTRAGMLPDEAQLDALWRQACATRADATPRWHVGGIEVRVFRGGLHLVSPAARPPGDVPWQGEASLAWGELGSLVFTPCVGQGLSAAVCRERSCRVCARGGGERLRPDCRRPSRPVKDWQREAGVPPWQRGSLPMLRVGDEPAWVAGLGVDCRFQAGPGEPGWLISWQPRP